MLDLNTRPQRETTRRRAVRESRPPRSREKQSGLSGVGSQKRDIFQERDVFQEKSVQQLEALLTTLRGEALLIATLSYGLGVRVSQLRAVRVRDLRLMTRSLMVAGRERCIPESIVDDLRECVQERLCGRDASMTGSHREQPLFSERGFCDLMSGCERVDGGVAECPVIVATDRGSRRFDSRLRVLGWLHRRWATRRGIRSESPLDLLDKGPRIVRRRSGGRVDSYYLWRVSPAL